MDEFKPHPSHKMTEWESTIVTITSTPRFGSIRACENCEAEEARTVAGRDHHKELELPCRAVREPTP